MGGWPACPSTLPCTSSCAPGNVCRYQTADVPFRVARLLLVEHNVAMHKVECSAGDAELHEFMKVKLKEDSEIYEECRAYNYAVRKQREEQEEFFKSQLWGREGGASNEISNTSAVVDKSSEGETAMGITSNTVGSGPAEWGQEGGTVAEIPNGRLIKVGRVIL